MSETTKVFALLSDPNLRRQVQLRWRSNGILLCGVHAEGGEALVAEVARLHPDIIVADAEVDGAREIIEVSARSHRIPVVALVRTQQQGMAALRPLDWGAMTLVVREQENLEQLLEILDSTLQQIKRARVVDVLKGSFPLSGAFPDAAVFDMRRAMQAVDPTQKLVVIAAGVGGPMIVRRILADLRGQSISPVLYLQDLAGPLLGTLVPWLEKHTGFEVLHASQGQELKIGQVHVAPMAAPAFRVQQEGSGYALRSDPAAPNDRPLDSLLKNVAEVFGPRALGVILSGFGSDGSEGMVALREAGGFTIVQDRASSMIDDTPRKVRDAGGAIECLPINEIAERIHMLMRPEHASHS